MTPEAPSASVLRLEAANAKLIAENKRLTDDLRRRASADQSMVEVLVTTGLAIIVLDGELAIRCFTPSTQPTLGIYASDVGRPLADLHLLGRDAELLADAAAVISTGRPAEREISMQDGAWYRRKIVRHGTPGAGVVIIYADMTGEHLAAHTLQSALRMADQANVAKSRFLASASHDLRQPLQTLALIQGLMAKMVHGTKQQELVARSDDALIAMTGILNALLDINQIEAGVVAAQIVDFPIADLLERIRDDFTFRATAQNIDLRSVACGANVRSDPDRLEQMIRNLCSNALKYTRTGSVLLGCRRRGAMLSIEIWDTGMGIASEEIGSIFDEYHQIGEPGRERSRGLGLGLSIVRRLGDLLGHRVTVKSQPGRGSVFAVEVPLAERQDSIVPPISDRSEGILPFAGPPGTILVVEDDPEVLALLEVLVRGDGHRIATASSGAAAVTIVAGGFQPDLVLADLGLPNGMDGLKVAEALRDQLEWAVPVIVLTGDISADALHRIASSSCVPVHKPARPGELTRIIREQLGNDPPSGRKRPLPEWESAIQPEEPDIVVVDDDAQVRESIRLVFEAEGRKVASYATGEEYLERRRPAREGCLLVDAFLPGMSGLELLRKIREIGSDIPAIMITGSSDVATAIAAMRAGAMDFIEKPISRIDLVASVERALAVSKSAYALRVAQESAARHLGSLTLRQRQILAMVLAGHPSKNIAADLHISQRTVENHRAAIMRKTGTKSLPALARLALSADAKTFVNLR